MLNFQGKTIVVTGASSGIGAETARQLRYAGASVIGMDRNEPTFTLDGFVKADLSEQAHIDAAVKQLPARVDALCNIAGVPGTSPVDLVAKVNYLGLRHLTLGLLGRMAAIGAVDVTPEQTFSEPERVLAAVQAEARALIERDAAPEPLRDPADTARRVVLGAALYDDHCAACHGVGGGGAKGYPNLNDDEWLWGGSLGEIHQTLQNGIRVAGNAETRISQMPAFGKDGLLKPAEIRVVANHVRALAGLPTEQGVDLAKGPELFATNCAACHGDAGKGNKELGAPNLTDADWLCGSDRASIRGQIYAGNGGVMPTWAGRLSPETIKALTVYIHSNAGGQ